ncbi:MAG: YdcF family protein [Gemmatimonadaceae bacterium]
MRTALFTCGVVWVAIMAAIILYGKRDDAHPGTIPADAIVVLGAAQYDGKPSPVLRARLDHALRLWQRHDAPLMIFTGGRGAGDTTSEAAVGRRYAMSRGVPDSAIALENRGATTSESMHAVAGILRGRTGRTVILVSDPFHMLRLSIVARRLGLLPQTSPTRTSPISASRSQQVLRVLGESVKVPAAWALERH